MRKIYLASVMVLLLAVGGFAQVTTNSGSGLAPAYPDLASAVTALNGATITTPVVITLAGNETAPAGGYNITAQGTAANTIIIQGSASTITASAALVAGTLTDAVFKLVGADYVTIKNFTMLENAANITTAAATNNMTEWGVALLYASTTNGAQNCTIQNNTVTLNRTYQNTFGIYSNSTHSATVPLTSASATTTAGANNGLKIYGNTISNVNNGILVLGPTAAADYNTGIDIGGAGGGDANTISNFGTTGTFSGYANVSGTVYGILIRNSIGYNISYNGITSSVGGVTSGTLRGIYNVSATVAPTGTFTNTINNNTIALTYGVSTGTLQGITVESINATGTSIENISNNNFTTLTASIASSVAITAISTTAAHLTVNINGNTFTNITTNTTGNFTFINHSYTMPAGGSQTINGNAIVTGFNKTGAGGTVTCNTSGSSSPNGTTHATTNNNFSNITVTGATAIQGSFSNDGSSSSPAKTVTGNNYSNWTGGTGSINAITYNYIGGPVSSISNNTFSNITGQSTVSAIVIGNTFAGATTFNVASNTISNVTSTGAGGSVSAISCGNTSTAININNNTISTLSSTGAAAVTGITVSSATVTNVFKNRICDLSGSNAGSTVNGIQVSGGTTLTVSNNRIGDLRTPVANAANPLIGISVTGGTTVNAYYNTVYLAGTSSGALFGSSALFASTSTALTLNNNILYNASGIAGAGLAVAYRRSSATLTSYGATSNRNDFTASTVYTDGVAPLTALAAYKALVGPARDANSLSVIPPFISTACGNAGFLKINPATGTQIESGGANIAAITDDFENDIRQGNGGYAGTGTAPDMGADEVEGTPAPVCSGTPASSTINGAAAVCSGLGTTLTLSNLYAELGFTYQWASGTTPGGPYTNLGTGNGQATGPLTVNTYYICTITCTNGGGSFTTPEKAVFVNALPTVIVSPTTGTLCMPEGSPLSLTASGTAVTYFWSPAAGLSGTTTSSVTALPTATTTYTVTGADGNGCINTATSTITVASAIAATATATPATLCAGANSQLNVTASALAGAIKITEVTLFRTGTGATVTYPVFATGADLVEVTNISGLPVDISGWTLADYASGAATPTHTALAFPSGTVIPANSVAVVCLGAGTDNIINRYFNTGGTVDTWGSGSVMGVVLKNGSAVIDAVGINSGYTFAAGTGVTAADWSGFAPSASTFAGTIRTVSADNNSGADWTQSSAGTPQTVGTYNPGFISPATIASYAWSPSTFIAGQEALPNPLATAVTATQAYSVLVTTTAGCTATANITVNTALDATINTEPLSAARCIGNKAFFKVKASGPALTYQWRKDGTPITNGGTIGGATTDSLFINGVVAGDAGVYTVLITPACGSTATSSNTVTLTVNTKPTVPVTPAGTIIICAGTAQTLNASGTNAASPAFAWLKNNTPISGATSATYAADTIASYRVKVTDGITGCFDTSLAVVIAFNPKPTTPTATATPATVCAGSNVNLSSLAGAGYNMNAAGIETFIDIEATGTSVGTVSDDSENNIGLPTFNFNGVNYTTARVGMNGGIALGSTTGDIVFGNAALPSTANSAGNILLLPWWDDLDIRIIPATNVKTQTVGSKFIIQYSNTVHNDDSTSNIKFQVQMDTANGKIHFVYDDVDLGNVLLSSGASATVGIQLNSTNAIQYSFNTASLTNGQCITFTPATLSYAWAGPNGFTSTLQNPALSNVSSLDSGAYTVTFTNTLTGCTNTASATVNVIPADTFEWTGAVSTDWTNAANWFCGGVPSATSKVIIRNSITNYPVVNLNVEIKSLTLRTGATVTVGTGFILKLNGN